MRGARSPPARAPQARTDDPLHHEYLDDHPRPPAGSYGAFLEAYQPLGVLPPGLLASWENFGFVGAMETASKMKLWYGGPSRRVTYAIRAGLRGFGSAATFLVRLLELVERQEPSTDAAGKVTT